MGEGCKLAEVADVAVIPFFFIAGIFFVLTPITNNQTRAGEHEADITTGASRQPDGFAQRQSIWAVSKMNPARWRNGFLIIQAAKSNHTPCSGSRESRLFR